MVFQTVRGCRRSEAEQRYIWALLEIWNALPAGRREEIRTLIGQLAETSAEGRALFDVAVRHISIRAVNARTGVSVPRLYDLRRQFYDRVRL